MCQTILILSNPRMIFTDENNLLKITHNRFSLLVYTTLNHLHALSESPGWCPSALIINIITLFGVIQTFFFFFLNSETDVQANLKSL